MWQEPQSEAADSLEQIFLIWNLFYNDFWLERGKEMCNVSTNLHGVDRLARPTSRWLPKAHHMMGETQQRHHEQLFGKNVILLGQTRKNFLSLS